jgi:ankyrin
LHFAARYGESSVVKPLLEHGADLTATDELGWTPLNTAIRFNQTDFVRQLLGKRADTNIDPDFRDKVGQTALHLAARWDRHGEITRLLLDAGADPNTQDQRGVAPLHIAAHHGNLVFVEILLTHASRVDASLRGAGRSPSQVADASGHPAIAKRISEHIANKPDAGDG